MDDAFELTIPSPTDLMHPPLANIWDTVAQPGTPTLAVTHTTATPTVTRTATATTVVLIVTKIGTPMVVTAVIGAIVAALLAVVVTHQITGGVGVTPEVLLGVAALARILMVLLQAMVQQPPLTRLRTVVVGEGSVSQGVPVVVSVIDRRKHGQEVSFVQAQMIEEVHGGHPAASLKLAMFSLLPYLEACKTWFSRSLFQTENQVQNFDYFACIRFRIFISLYYYVLHYQLSFP